MRILGIASHTHDSGVALLCEGAPEVVIEEERLNREKKTKRFPSAALSAAITERGLKLRDVDAITIPWHIPTFWRTLGWAFLRKFPRSLNLIHMRAHPPQQNQLLRGRRYLARLLRGFFGASALPPMHYIGHHDSHAAAYFMSPFDDATVLVMDGYGDDASTSLYLGQGNTLRRIWRTNLFNSLGIVYTVVTQHLGFRPNQDEGKVMALAAYGQPTYLSAFRDVVYPLPEGRYRVNMKYFSYDCFGLYQPFKPLFFDRFGPPRQPDEPLTEHHHDLAYALQTVTEEAILHMTGRLARDFPSRNLCLTGGVALNCVANARILEETEFTRVWIPPNASDSGAPLGSTLWHYHVQLGWPRRFQLTHPYYGKEYTAAEMEAALRASGLPFERLPDAELTRRVARDLADGKIVGWFQGRFEMGPRALGNRSILADPRRAEMKNLLNRRVKHREPFRPFAPAILRERVAEWFEISQADPFMTLAPRVRVAKAPLIPAALHVDQTARVQTVERPANARFYQLIEHFEQLTGVPILLNTSFNRQEPIVASPADAISCYLRTDMDVLVLGNCYSVSRTEGISATLARTRKKAVVRSTSFGA
jgi:carbamoyltransferase